MVDESFCLRSPCTLAFVRFDEIDDRYMYDKAHSPDNSCGDFSFTDNEAEILETYVRLELYLTKQAFSVNNNNKQEISSNYRTPPMGWMSWTAFNCEMDCTKHSKTCINENLYMEMADALVRGGYQAAGYVTVHVDDCWMERKRDKSTGRLVADRARFPSGIHKLSSYMHARGLKFGIYEDYGTKTCAGFPGSLGHLRIDAETFADWEVDYLKLDGCNIDTSFMPKG
ncbi:hypothetical protein DICVIV_11179 [Dictyocaulus viviparus]|uniref:Alpha-galactosidase n=1 Tax=Dictyocaulus viviparus TaxID=29172 RepID=A0A0D8XGF9_DICVI|nr:hypothetical protein DICVIV_11179 [Dictyocaulus viviparus]